ncbi:ABC transporter ATP-binding protein [Candidatus Methylopumilus planktonicus]|uniref:ABC transporter ATP-binding protein n=1 Tax=Candidatus Methylopumilus planktonicus TaxID=1581557 RepID=UPI003D18B98F
MKKSLITLLSSLWSHIDSERRKQFIFLLFLTLLSLFAEVISLSAILPFIGIITQPEKVFSSHWFEKIIEQFGLVSDSELVLPLALAFAFAAIIAGILRLFLLRASIHLSSAAGAVLSIEIYRRTLYQDYSVHISRNSSEIISGITQKVGTVTSVLFSVVAVITSSLLFIAIVFALLIANPIIAIYAITIFGCAYGLIALLTRHRLAHNSFSISTEQTFVHRALQEGLGGIRDVLLDGTQEIYCNVYKKAIVKLQLANGENIFINQAPRFAMESLGMVLIALLVFGLTNSNGGLLEALPILAMLALSAQKLLPLMQQFYGNWSVVMGSKASLVEVLSLLNQPLPSYIDEPVLIHSRLKQSIEFRNVSFRYGSSTPLVLNQINFSISKGSRVGIIGITGSGKSTILDLLLGLLKPSEGKILIDGSAIKINNLRSWQHMISHVPQNIFLADASIAENIAFGIPINLINLDRVKKVAKQANIDEFIEARHGAYNSIVGERGVRLSGGQRQRIGIARALYKEASVLIFDEATSSLDNNTEQSVMQAIEGLSKDLTLFIIAHRISTLKNCNQIIVLEGGSIKKITTYRELISNV